MVYYTTYVVHTKKFFWDFDKDSYAQNSEIILTIRIQKNFFKIPIGKFFEKLSKSKKKNLCVPHMWYTIPHLWVKVTTYVVYYTTYVVYYTTNVYSPEIPILFDRSKAQNNSFTMAADPLPGQYLDLKYTLASEHKLTAAKTLMVFGIYKTYIEFNPDGSMAYIPHITT